VTTFFEFLGSLTLFACRVIRDGLRSPLEIGQIWRQIGEVGSRSLALISTSGLALGVVMTLHTRSTLVPFEPARWRTCGQRSCLAHSS
jgi:phospholipid/cholesterol/gamma-HCH transport system permease protein